MVSMEDLVLVLVMMLKILGLSQLMLILMKKDGSPLMNLQLKHPSQVDFLVSREVLVWDHSRLTQDSKLVVKKIPLYFAC